MLSIATILGITSYCLIFIAILVYLLIWLIVLKNRRELHDITLFLTCNTCVSAFLTCVTSCVMTSSNLFSGFLLRNMTFCYAWGLFYDIFECSIYYSYCIQGFYRLCRVVFYKKKFLLSYSLYILLIIGQWLFILALLLPPVFINWYTRIPTETYCLIPYTSIGPEVYHILILYLGPLFCLSGTYFWITRYMRGVSQTTTIAVIQRQRNQRDLSVIKRILLLISLLIVLRFPTVILMIYGVIAGSLHPLTYAIVGLITSACLILIGLITIYITSQFRKQILNFFFPRNNRIQTEPIPLNRMSAPIAAIANGSANPRSKRKIG